MKKSIIFLIISLITISRLQATKVVDVKVIDKDYIMIHFKDGDVTFKDDGTGPYAYYGHIYVLAEDNEVVTYGSALSINNAVSASNWLIKSSDDSNYGQAGENPDGVYRKTKMNGHARMNDWNNPTEDWEYTKEHFLYLEMPNSMQQGKTYTIEINSNTNADELTHSFTYDIYSSVSEAIHINLVGYNTSNSVKAADLYCWMGDMGAREYSGFEGNIVYLYDVNNDTSYEVGTVEFWKSSGDDVVGYNLTQSDVYKADFTGFKDPGTYRLAIEGVGCSQDFEIRNDIYYEPFKVSLQGYFYMRVGEDSVGVKPVPRRPLYIQDTDPADCKIYLTTLDPYDPEWENISGDPWDKPHAFESYVKSGSPTNPNAIGGHSDALDWDRNLKNISSIYDLLLPFYLSKGTIDDDNLGIAESGNGIPDVIDEARNEVDFWLNLRDGKGYSHGLTNPNSNNELFQGGETALAAWVNAANAAMLSSCFKISGHTDLMEQYRDSAINAYNYAGNLANPMLDESFTVGGNNYINGGDLKMMAAAYLYDVTGNTDYEDVINDESVVQSTTSEINNRQYNQLWATAGYLFTDQDINYPDLYNNMKESVIYQARQKEAGYSNIRPSRRATEDIQRYMRTANNVQRTIVAHAITDDPNEKQEFESALVLEADYGLGRNPLSMIQMTTATTALQSKRSIENCYTTGRNDGSIGLHPGHTPYLNLDDWTQKTMGSPSALYQHCYPDFNTYWPMGEGYFNTRYVWAHGEFTPRQTMRGKMALYAYLYNGAEHSGDTEAPTAPTNLTATDVTETSFTLSWIASTDSVGVEYYEVFQDGVSVSTTTSTSKSISGLICNTSYSMTVKAYDAAGNISAASTAKSVTTSACSDTIAPTAPTNLTDTDVTAISFTLSWTASTDSVGVEYYEVFQDGVSVGTTTSTSKSISGLSYNTSYSMTVKAYDAAGNISAASTAKSVTTSACSDTIAPTAPTNLTDTDVTAISFTLSWIASTDSVGVEYYEVFQDGVSVSTTTSTSKSISGLSCNTSYSMTVKAYDAAGNVSVASSALSVTTSACSSTTDCLLTNPSFESDLQSWTINSGTIDISSNATDGVKSARLYGTQSGMEQGYINTIAEGTSVTVSIDAYIAGDVGWAGVGLDFRAADNSDILKENIRITNTSWQSKTIVANAPAGTEKLVVWAYTSSGELYVDNFCIIGSGLESDTVAPTAPTNLTSTDVTETSFTLSWTASTDSVGVEYYEVFQDGVSVSTTTSTSKSISGLSCNISYSMTVKAYDAAGNVSVASSALSVTTSACSDTVALTAPTNLAATDVTDTSFTLSWTASTDSVGVEYYEVFQDGVSVSTTTSTSKSISGLSCNISYSMTVKAYDAAGNVSVASSALSVTTSACSSTTDCLLTNPSFESDLQNWTINSGTIDISSNATDGVKSARLYGTQSGMEQVYINTIAEGTSVTVSIDAYIAGDVGWAGVGLDFRAADNSDILKENIRITNTSWQSKTIVANAPAGTEKLVVWAYTSSGELYVDNFCISGNELKSGSVSSVVTLLQETKMNDLHVSLYPNPVINGYVNLRLENYSEAGNLTLHVYDISGRLVYSQDIEVKGESTHTIDCSNLNKGMYLFKISGKEVNRTINVSFQ